MPACTELPSPPQRFPGLRHTLDFFAEQSELFVARQPPSPAKQHRRTQRSQRSMKAVVSFLSLPQAKEPQFCPSMIYRVYRQDPSGILPPHFLIFPLLAWMAAAALAFTGDACERSKA